MPEAESYDYALVRVTPSVERGEFINCGAIVFCKTRRFLGAVTSLDEERLRAIDARADVAEIRKHLDLIPRICDGDPAAGPIAQLSQSERFNWLVAPRSAVIQTSPVHSGMGCDPKDALDRLMKTMVRTPGKAAPANP